MKETKALTSLKRNDSIVIVKSEKGNSTVVMDKNGYENKIENHLSDTSTYCDVNSNPSNTLQTKVNNELRLLKQLSLLTEEN